MKFTKMQGLGNDYIYLNCLEAMPEDLPGLAVRLSARHFGVGADGLICICPSGAADVGMRMFNADGSEGEMCGNGIRCLGKYVYDKGLVPGTALRVETPAGVRALELCVEDGAVYAVTVDMGEPAVDEPRMLALGSGTYRIRPVSMGNPHAVLYLDHIDDLDLAALGPSFEHHPSFPCRTNTEFVERLDRSHLKMRVWERGSGETLACGTGACAALAAAVADGRAERRASVLLRGGTLHLRWERSNNHIYMTGPAVTVFEGEIDCGQGPGAG